MPARFKLIEHPDHGYVVLHRCDGCGTFHPVYMTWDFGEVLALVCVTNQLGAVFAEDDARALIAASAQEN